MPSTPQEDEQELKTLRLLRATLESVSQLLTAVDEDVDVLVGNVRRVGDISTRLKAVVGEVEREGGKGGEGMDE